MRARITNVSIMKWMLLFVSLITSQFAVRSQDTNASNEFGMVDKQKVMVPGKNRTFVDAVPSPVGGFYLASVDDRPSPLGPRNSFVLHSMNPDQPSEIKKVRSENEIFSGLLYGSRSPTDRKASAFIAKSSATRSGPGTMSMVEFESGTPLSTIQLQESESAQHLRYCDERKLLSFFRVLRKRGKDTYTFVVYDMVAKRNLRNVALANNEIPTDIAFSTDGRNIAVTSNRYSKITVNLRGEVVQNEAPDVAKGLVETQNQAGVLRIIPDATAENATEIVFEGMTFDSVCYDEEGKNLFVGTTVYGDPELVDAYGLGLLLPVYKPTAAIVVLDATSGAEVQQIVLPYPKLKSDRLKAVPRVMRLDLSRNGTLLAVGIGSYNLGERWAQISLVSTASKMICAAEVLSPTEPFSFLALSEDADYLVAKASGAELVCWRITRPTAELREGNP